MAILDLATLKSLLGVSGTDYDTPLTAVVNATNSKVKTFLGYDPETTSVTDYVSPRGGRVITLPSAPPSDTSSKIRSGEKLSILLLICSHFDNASTSKPCIFKDIFTNVRISRSSSTTNILSILQH